MNQSEDRYPPSFVQARIDSQSDFFSTDNDNRVLIPVMQISPCVTRPRCTAPCVVIIVPLVQIRGRVPPHPEAHPVLVTQVEAVSRPLVATLIDIDTRPQIVFCPRRLDDVVVLPREAVGLTPLVLDAPVLGVGLVAVQGHLRQGDGGGGVVHHVAQL